MANLISVKLKHTEIIHKSINIGVAIAANLNI